jgi:hypothetical protein
MEKKEYIEPSMIVRMVNMNASILAGSITIDLGDGETIGGDGGEGNADDAAAKGYSTHDVWED